MSWTNKYKDGGKAKKEPVKQQYQTPSWLAAMADNNKPKSDQPVRNQVIPKTRFLTKEETEKYEAEVARSKQPVMRQATPEEIKGQSLGSKAWEVVTNPMTAAQYAINKRPIPDHFSQTGDRNVYDMAVDMVNPFGIAEAARKIPGNISDGNYGEAFLNGLSVLPALAEVRSSKIIPRTINNIKEAANSKWDPMTYLTNLDPHEINAGNIGSYYGKPLSNTGGLNEGVFEVADFPEYLIKLENPNRVGKALGNADEYVNMSFPERMKGVSHIDNISHIENQIDGVLPYKKTTGDANLRALVMKRKPGQDINNMTIDDWMDIPEEAFKDVGKVNRELANNKLGIDYVGDNFLYDKASKKFQMIDINPHVSNADHYWTNSVMKGVSPGLPKAQMDEQIREAIKARMKNSFSYNVPGNALDDEELYQQFYNKMQQFNERLDNSLTDFKEGGKVKNNLESEKIFTKSEANSWLSKYK